MEPAPPPITIVDPNNPSGTADLLESRAEPWRASPRQKLAVALTAVIVALISAGVADIRHVHHERALDAAAVRDVELSVAASSSGTEEQVVLTNLGRLPVRVLGITLVGDGYQERRNDVALMSQGTSGVELSAAKNCRPALFTEDPTKVRVRARTARGQIVTRTLDLPSDLSSQIGYWERYRCGYQRPEEALSDEVVSTLRRGRDVVVTLSLHNGSVVPLTVLGIGSLQGVSAKADLPLTLPPRAFWTGRSPARRFTVTLRVTDCALFTELVSAGQDEDGAYGFINVELSNGHTAAFTGIPVVNETWFGDEPPVNRAQQLLLKTCP